MGWGVALGIGANLLGGLFGSRAADKAKRDAKEKERLARQEMDRLKDMYSNLDTSNPYLNMENTMEDLTVNTQAAEFAAEQSQASTANVLNNMNQAAGGSGVAALAQAMANQGQIGAQKASISIAQQEKANQDAERKQAGVLQNLEREGEIQSRNLKKDMAATALGMAGADVQQTAGDIKAADQQMMEGVDDFGSAVGTYAGGIG